MGDVFTKRGKGVFINGLEVFIVIFRGFILPCWGVSSDSGICEDGNGGALSIIFLYGEEGLVGSICNASLCKKCDC